MPDNLFRQALEILNTKNGAELTEEEQEVLSAAMIPLNIRGCPFPEDMTVGECLEKLAQLINGQSNGNKA